MLAGRKSTIQTVTVPRVNKKLLDSAYDWTIKVLLCSSSGTCPLNSGIVTVPPVGYIGTEQTAPVAGTKIVPVSRCAQENCWA